jgi:hypothetical protein
MAVSGNFKNGPLSPMGWATGPAWATGLFCKKNLRFGPRSAQRGGSGPVTPLGRQGRSAAGGPVAPPTGDRVPLYISPHPYSLLI